MDTLVEIVRVSEPNFYNRYKSARKLVNTGKRGFALQLLVEYAQSLEPLKGEASFFYPNGETGRTITATEAPVLTKKTANKGRLSLRALAGGTCQMRLKKEGYVTQTQIAYINARN